MNPGIFAALSAVSIAWMIYKATGLAREDREEREQERLEQRHGR